METVSVRVWVDLGSLQALKGKVGPSGMFHQILASVSPDAVPFGTHFNVKTHRPDDL